MALLAEMGMADENREAEFGFLLHDCGKVGIPESVLNKPGPLTAAEWRVMRAHPIIGYQLVADIPFLRTAAQVVRCHHEMFDGTGYPAGLRGAEIQVAARGLSVVDALGPSACATRRSPSARNRSSSRSTAPFSGLPRRAAPSPDAVFPGASGAPARPPPGSSVAWGCAPRRPCPVALTEQLPPTGRIPGHARTERGRPLPPHLPGGPAGRR